MYSETQILPMLGDWAASQSQLRTSEQLRQATE
jgi:hypothetical protein